MSKKISEISSDLKKNFPEVPEQYKRIFNVRNITEMLEKEGLLYSTEGGRRPTELGKQNGISEYLRTGENGQQFYQVEYNLQGEQIIYDMLIRVLQEINSERHDAEETEMIVTQEQGIEATGRRGAQTIRENHPGYLIFQEAEERNWAFDESAQDICRIINVEPYRNANGEYGVSFKSKDFRSFVEPELKSHEKNYIVNNGIVMKIVSFLTHAVHHPAVAGPAAQPVPANQRARTVRLGDWLSLNSNEGRINVYLATEETGNYVPVVRPGGSIDYVYVPVVERDGFRILSPRSQLSIALLGKKVNDTISVNGFQYKILSID